MRLFIYSWHAQMPCKSIQNLSSVLHIFSHIKNTKPNAFCWPEKYAFLLGINNVFLKWKLLTKNGACFFVIFIIKLIILIHLDETVLPMTFKIWYYNIIDQTASGMRLEWLLTDKCKGNKIMFPWWLHIKQTMHINLKIDYC